MKRLALALIFSLPVVAHAQSATLASARADLATYDTSGHRTLDALRALGPVAAGASADAHEAAYLRAVAAADLHVVALGLADAALDARLAEAMGVPVEALAAELRTELTHAETGLFRGPAVAELALLTHVEAFVAGPTALDLGNAREAGLFVLGAGRAAGAHDFGTLRVSGAAAGARGIAEIRAALAAYDRASRAARDGDPLLVAWSSAMDAARVTLLAYEVRVAPAITDASFAIAAAEEGASVGEAPDVLVVIDAARVAIACGARVRVASSGLTTTPPSPSCPAAGTLRVIALPATLPAVPTAIDELVAAFTALALPAGTVVAIAPTPAAPMHVLTRVVRSLTHASLTPSALVLAGSELTTSTLALAATTDTPSVTIHVRLGGYAIARTHGHDAQVPRVRGASGLAYDPAGLRAALATDRITAASVDGMGPVPAVEVLRTLRLLASFAPRVTLALP